MPRGHLQINQRIIKDGPRKDAAIQRLASSILAHNRDGLFIVVLYRDRRAVFERRR